jgi:hypothetical protein
MEETSALNYMFYFGARSKPLQIWDKKGKDAPQGAIST